MRVGHTGDVAPKNYEAGDAYAVVLLLARSVGAGWNNEQYEGGDLDDAEEVDRPKGVLVVDDNACISSQT